VNKLQRKLRSKLQIRQKLSSLKHIAFGNTAVRHRHAPIRYFA
jgi:hypothetical protein